MMLVELTSVASAVLPVAELADHLRLARGFADDGSQDARLESVLRAAVSAIEARIGKALYLRRFGLTLNAWQTEAEHVLPLAPVDSVESVKILTRAGAETLIDPDRYDLVRDLHRPLLRSAATKLPAPSQGGSIEVEFLAGFSTDWVGMPSDLKQAVLIQAGEYYGQDLEADRGIPFAVSVLLEPYRALRLRGGADMTRPALTRKLQLEAPDRVADGAGGFIETWVARGTIWGEVAVRGAGREIDDAARLRLKITVRSAPQGAPSRPTAAMRFVDGGRVYAIEAVTERDPDGRYLTCFATEEVGA